MKDMKIGQKYSFSTEEKHPSPFFIVCQIDSKKGKDIASIYIGGLKFTNPHSDSGYGNVISHAPVEVQCLMDSGIDLIEEDVETPDYLDGYNTWREVFESGQGGYFTISAADVVKYIIETVNS